MNKWIKKAAAGFAAASITIGSAGILPENTAGGWNIAASAEGNENVPVALLQDQFVDTRVIEISEDELFEIEETVKSDYEKTEEAPVKKASSKYSYSSDYFYKQLSPSEQQFYNKLQKSCERVLTSQADFSSIYFSGSMLKKRSPTFLGFIYSGIEFDMSIFMHS